MEELTEVELLELQEKLIALSAQLIELIELSKESSKPVALDQARVGRISRMAAIQSQQLAKAGLESHRVRLAKVTQALKLIESGDYGFCRRCEEPIGIRRLRVSPEAPFCITCQGAVE